MNSAEVHDIRKCEWCEKLYCAVCSDATQRNHFCSYDCETENANAPKDARDE